MSLFACNRYVGLGVPSLNGDSVHSESDEMKIRDSFRKDQSKVLVSQRQKPKLLQDAGPHLIWQIVVTVMRNVKKIICGSRPRRITQWSV